MTVCQFSIPVPPNVHYRLGERVVVTVDGVKKVGRVAGMRAFDRKHFVDVDVELRIDFDEVSRSVTGK